jgi:hypothetical protein
MRFFPADPEEQIKIFPIEVKPCGPVFAVSSPAAVTGFTGI